MVGRRHHHHHHGIGGAVGAGLGAGLLGLGLGLATAAVLTTPSRPTVTVTSSPSSCTFWHGCRPRWLPNGFVVSSTYNNNRSMWVSQASTLFHQHTMGLTYLTKRTFKRAMMCLGVHKHQAKHIFFLMDQDRNGIITLDEFINAYLFVMSGGLAYRGTGFTGMSGVAYPTSFSLQPNQTVTVTTTQYQQQPTQSVTTYHQVPTYQQPQPMYQPPQQQHHQTVTYQQNITYQQPPQQQSYYQPIPQPQQPQPSYYQPQPQVYNPQPYGQPTSYNPNMPPPQPFAQPTSSVYQPPQPPVYQQPRYY